MNGDINEIIEALSMMEISPQEDPEIVHLAKSLGTCVEALLNIQAKTDDPEVEEFAARALIVVETELSQ